MRPISDGDSNPQADYHRLYSIWSGVKRRCLAKSCRDYGWYGARGITLCNQWKDSYKAFKEWSLQNGYDRKKTLDRIDTLGNYQPGNCRWASHKVQNNNRTTNVRIDYKGESYTLAELAEKFGISKATVKDRKRRKGLDISELIKKTPERRMITLRDGSKISLRDGATALGLPYRTIVSRYRKYGDDHRRLGWGD